MSKFVVFQDTEQWVPLFRWFWHKSDKPGKDHGPYPARWMAYLAGLLATR